MNYSPTFLDTAITPATECTQGEKKEFAVLAVFFFVCVKLVKYTGCFRKLKQIPPNF